MSQKSSHSKKSSLIELSEIRDYDTYRVMSLTPLLPYHVVADVGCGSGKFCRVVKDDGICDIVHGVDIVDSVIAPIEGIMFDFGYHAHMLPYGDNQFDVVTSFNVLEFNIVEDIPVILDELFRVASKQVFLSVSKVESKGYRNEVGELHATIRNAGWWGKQLAKFRGDRYYFIEWTSTDFFWAIDVR